MMKTIVFHIITHLEMGGAERVAINIAKSQSPQFEYHVVEVVKGNSDYTSSMLEELKEHGIIVHRSNIGNNKKAILLFPFRFIRLFRRYHPNVIHSHTEVPDLSLFLFSKLFPSCRYKLVRTIHNTQLWNEWKKIGCYVEKWFDRRNANISISMAVTSSYKQNWGGVNRNIRMIYNGIATSAQLPFPDLSPNKTNILFAARFTEQKGGDALIDIVKNVDKSKFSFTIAGHGPLGEHINEQLSAWENVTVIPPISNLSHYLGSFDYVLMPSVFEGLGLLSIEASLSGTLAIINAISGLSETLPED